MLQNAFVLDDSKQRKTETFFLFPCFLKFALLFLLDLSL